MSIMDVFTPPRSGQAARVGGIFNEITLRVQQYRTYRQTLEELEALSDRELLDLGLSRTQLRGIAYRAAYSG